MTVVMTEFYEQVNPEVLPELKQVRPSLEPRRSQEWGRIEGKSKSKS
jgi:hypothetical protein